ncbi:unnamed protein product, partial [Owenia fusiformis]
MPNANPRTLTTKYHPQKFCRLYEYVITCSGNNMSTLMVVTLKDGVNSSLTSEIMHKLHNVQRVKGAIISAGGPLNIFQFGYFIKTNIYFYCLQRNPWMNIISADIP